MICPNVSSIPRTGHDHANRVDHLDGMDHTDHTAPTYVVVIRSAGPVSIEYRSNNPGNVC